MVTSKICRLPNDPREPSDPSVPSDLRVPVYFGSTVPNGGRLQKYFLIKARRYPYCHR